jgi:ATP-binding cassette subfamily B protein
MALGGDRDAVAGMSVDRGVIRRAWGFARPYKGMIVGFLVTIVLDAVLGLAPPLLFREIIDRAIRLSDGTLVTWLAIATVFVALADAGLAIAQRFWSARIGEGLIYELRSALFDHVQRLPIAFFTRTQTGALISRMNNDVIGAQQAVTNTLGTVFSNVVSVVVTISFMLALEWRLTLLTLVILPLFIIPAKRMGPKLQRLTRESMQLNASMNNTITGENVAYG